MAFLKRLLIVIFFLVGLLLIKHLLTLHFPHSQYYHRPLLSALQFYIFEGFILFSIVDWILNRLWKNQARTGYINLSLIFIVFIIQETIFVYWINNPKMIPQGLRSSFRYYYNYVDMDEIQYNPLYSEYDKKYFYRFKPNLKFRFKNREFDTFFSINKISLRDDKESEKSSEIICIGDSYTLGWGANQNEDFPSRLQQQLGRNVLNAGMVSFGTAREFNRLNELDLSGAKYIIWQYCTNDFDENKVFINNNFVLPIKSKDQYTESVEYRKSSAKYFPGKYFFSIFKLYIDEKLKKLATGHKPAITLGVNENDIAQQAKSFVEIVSRSKIDFTKTKVIVLHLDEISFSDSFYKALNSLLQEKLYRDRFLGNLQVIDLSHKLNKEDFYILDTHLNSRGYQKVASELKKMIVY